MSNEIVSMKDFASSLAAKLAEQKNTMPPATSSRIKMRKAEGFILPDGSALDSLEAVIVGMRYINTLYTKRYVPGQIESPDCWALNEDYSALAPDPSVSNPRHGTCEGCPMNEWGSSPVGAGKACGNKVRLALVTPDSDSNSTIYTLDLPPTSAAGVIKLMRSLITSQRPYQTVTMRLTMDKKVDYPKAIVELFGDAPDSLAPHLLGLMERSAESLDRGFDYA